MPEGNPNQPAIQTQQTQAIESLKAAKAQGLTYYDATQSLLKQGFTQEEIEQASYQFPYSEAAPVNSSDASQNVSVNQAFAEAVVHEEAIDNAKQELHEDAARGLLGGRSLFGSYYKNKAIGDYAALKNLENNKPTDGLSGNEQAVPFAGGRVFSRNPAIRIYAFISLIPLVVLGPYFFLLIRNAPSITHALFHAHGIAAFTTLGMYLWSAGGYFAYICIAALLFFAHKTSTITRAIYVIMGVSCALFALFAFITKLPTLLVFGIITMIPAFWISKRVGLLAQLD